MVRIVGVQVIDLCIADMLHALSQIKRLFKRRIVHLHIGGHADGARALLRCGYLLNLRERKADGFFYEHVFAGVKCCNSCFCFRVSVAEQNGVYIA